MCSLKMLCIVEHHTALCWAAWDALRPHFVGRVEDDFTHASNSQTDGGLR